MDHYQQVDLILLDFRKAFDTVPHRRLLSKLLSNEICNHADLFLDIASWLTKRNSVDGITSRWVSVKSGVPQGTVLHGPTYVLALY